jgi:hypothetical protein
MKTALNYQNCYNWHFMSTNTCWPSGVWGVWGLKLLVYLMSNNTCWPFSLHAPGRWRQRHFQWDANLPYPACKRKVYNLTLNGKASHGLAPEGKESNLVINLVLLLKTGRVTSELNGSCTSTNARKERGTERGICRLGTSTPKPDRTKALRAKH